MDIITKAKRFAINAHGDINHRRKYTGEPYVFHSIEASNIVASVTKDLNVIAAALLHDVVEDTPCTSEDIYEIFGADIGQLVAEVTDISKPSDGNRAVRKAKDREHLAGASVRGKESLYCHPDDLSGDVLKDTIVEVEALVSSAKTFESRWTDTYNTAYDMDSGTLTSLLDDCRDELLAGMFDAFQTKRKTLFYTELRYASVLRKCSNEIAEKFIFLPRSGLSRVFYVYTEEILNELVRKGLIIHKEESGRNYYRSRNKTEMRAFKKPAPISPSDTQTAPMFA